MPLDLETAFGCFAVFQDLYDPFAIAVFDEHSVLLRRREMCVHTRPFHSGAEAYSLSADDARNHCHR